MNSKCRISLLSWTFFGKAGIEIESVEVALMLLEKNADKFKLGPVEGPGLLAHHSVNERNVVQYKLTPSYRS